MSGVTKAVNPGRKRRYAPRMPLEQRREDLLDAALRVLARDGYGAVSIEAIAREAGVTRPVVYHAFDGLEPLLHALLDRSQRRALESAMDLLSAQGAPTGVEDWLLRGAADLIEIVQREPEIWRPILGITQNAPAVVRDRIAATREYLRTLIAQRLRLGLAEQGGPDLDTDVLAHIVLITAEHFGRLVLEQPELYSRDRLIAALTGLFRAAPTSD
jgi:AcrR family transcriptional regulator